MLYRIKIATVKLRASQMCLITVNKKLNVGCTESNLIESFFLANRPSPQRTQLRLGALLMNSGRLDKVSARTLARKSEKVSSMRPHTNTDRQTHARTQADQRHYGHKTSPRTERIMVDSVGDGDITKL